MFSGFNLVFEIFGFCLKSCNENSTKRCIKILWCRFVSSTSLRCYFTDEGKIFCLCYVNVTYENEKKNLIPFHIIFFASYDLINTLLKFFCLLMLHPVQNESVLHQNLPMRNLQSSHGSLETVLNFASQGVRII